MEAGNGKRETESAEVQKTEFRIYSVILNLIQDP
jgi:hypothetical protein